MPPVAIVLIFILQFFTWVGVYPGNVAAVTQNAWQAAFGGYTEDKDMKGIYEVKTEEEGKKTSETKDASKEVSNKPGWSLLTLFYLIPFFLATLLVTLAVAGLPYINNVPLPAQVQMLLPWRWAIVAGLNALLLLFIGLQLLSNFDLERKAKTWIENRPEITKVPADTKQEKLHEYELGRNLAWLQRTFWFRLVVLLHILATASAAMVYWIEKRGPSRPLPKIELMW